MELFLKRFFSPKPLCTGEYFFFLIAYLFDLFYHTVVRWGCENDVLQIHKHGNCESLEDPDTERQHRCIAPPSARGGTQGNNSAFHGSANWWQTVLPATSPTHHKELTQVKFSDSWHINTTLIEACFSSKLSQKTWERINRGLVIAASEDRSHFLLSQQSGN